MKKATPIFFTKLPENEVFVFGSNMKGLQWSSYSRMAQEFFGAVWNQPSGPMGQSYCIRVDSFDLDSVKASVDEFIAYAKTHPDVFFWVTELKSYFDSNVIEPFAEMFRDCLSLDNIALPMAYLDVLGCPGEEVSMGPEPELVDGHWCIDLGLDAKWGLSNLGAESPGETGGYFSPRNLDPDPATVELGPSWRIPEWEDLRQLLDFCYVFPASYGDMPGMLFGGPSGGMIFLPHAGYMEEGVAKGLRELAHYMSSEVYDYGDGEEVSTLDYDPPVFSTTSMPLDVMLPIRPIVIVD